MPADGVPVPPGRNSGSLYRPQGADLDPVYFRNNFLEKIEWSSDGLVATTFFRRRPGPNSRSRKSENCPKPGRPIFEMRAHRGLTAPATVPKMELCGFAGESSRNATSHHV